jgi:hypothetical protein
VWKANVVVVVAYDQILITPARQQACQLYVLRIRVAVRVCCIEQRCTNVHIRLTCTFNLHDCLIALAVIAIVLVRKASCSAVSNRANYTITIHYRAALCTVPRSSKTPSLSSASQRLNLLLRLNTTNKSECSSKQGKITHPKEQKYTTQCTSSLLCLYTQ